MKYLVCGIAVYLICHALLVAATTSAEQSKGSSGPVVGGQVVSYHPHCTEKNPAPDCIPVPQLVSSPPPVAGSLGFAPPSTGRGPDSPVLPRMLATLSCHSGTAGRARSGFALCDSASRVQRARQTDGVDLCVCSCAGCPCAGARACTQTPDRCHLYLDPRDSRG